jgi:hypothetical protein
VAQLAHSSSLACVGCLSVERTLCPNLPKMKREKTRTQ